MKVLQKNKILILPFFVASLLFVGSLEAQQNSFIRYTENEGLQSNITYYNYQDTKGYLWIATGSGVARYDGYAFKTYTTEDGMSDNEVFEIYEDSQNRIWFVTHNSAPSYYKDGIFYSAKNDSTLKKITTSGMGLKVVEDDDKNIWYLTTNELVKIAKEGNIKTYACDLIDGAKQYYFTMGYHHSKLILVDLAGIKILQNGKESRLHINGFAPPTSPCKSIMSNNTFYYTTRKALYSIDCNTLNEVAKDTLPLFPISIANGASNQALLIGTFQGLIEYRIPTKTLSAVCFKGEAISSSLIDSENGMWFSTLNNGIIYTTNRKSFLFENTSKTSFGNVTGLKQLSAQMTIIGYENYSFSIIKNNKIHDFHFDLEKGQGLIKKFELGPDSSIYISASPYLLIVDKDLTKVDIIPFAITNLKFRRNTAYITAGSSCLTIKDFKKQIVIDFQDPIKREENYQSGKAKKWSSIKSFGVCLDTDTSLYIYGSYGIKRFENENEKAFKFSAEPLFKESVYALKKSNSGWFWFISNKGACMFNKDTFYLLNTDNGLSSVFLNNIYFEPGNEAVWIATDNGLDKIEYTIGRDQKIQFSVRAYTISSGLLSNRVNDVFIKNDSLWISSPKGINIICKKDLETSNKNMALNLETIFIDGVAKNIGDATSIEIQSDQSLKITYVGISFRNPKNILYSYLLEGLTEEWNQSNSKELDFPKLPPGEYEFLLKGQDADGDSTGIKKLKIVVIPKYFETVWFRILILLFILILLAMLIFKIFKNQNIKHNKNKQILLLENQKLDAEKEKAIYEKELVLLEQKALRLHINPHFIFNSISAISGFYISGNYEAGKDYTSRFSKLLRLIMSTTENSTIALSTEIEILRNYFELTLLRFENKFDYYIDIDPELNPEHVFIPSMLIQPFIENSVIHGIGPLEAKGLIRVSFRKTNNSLTCTIDDNGVGRKKALELSKGRLHRPTGMIVTEERIKYFSHYQDQLEIIDKKDADGNPTGTCIIFKILFELKK